MPELPEVETTARLIRPHVIGRSIRSAEVYWLRSVGGGTHRAFSRGVVGARITDVGRRAKFIRMDLSRGRTPAGALLVHLRMSGRLLVTRRAQGPGPHVRVRLGLGGGRFLEFVDVRKFGRMVYTSAPEVLLAGLGPEPLGPAFTVAWLRAAVRDRRRMLKPLLLDQSFLAGLGNIYVDEALHRVRLHPRRRAHTLRGAAIARLHRAIREILHSAIEQQGSSFDGFYRTPEGRPGGYQSEFRVYGRAGEPCDRCGATIRRLVVGQRGTHICPRCQRAPRP